MVTKSSCEGLIFLLHDKCSSLDGSKHNYIILGTNNDHEKIGLIQCMSITSMYDKDVTIEVPILLSNNMISYIVPYNIHSFSSSDIDMHNFKGCITDVEYIGKYEFMQLLIDLYADTLDLGLVDHDDVMKRYYDYCDAFWKYHGENTEYRDYKESKQDEIMIELPKTNNKKKSYKSKRQGKRSKQNAIRKQEKIEKREFENMVREVTGTSSSDVLSNSTEKYNKFNISIPYSEDAVCINDIKLDDLTALNDAPRNSKDFSDNELILFLKGYDKFSYDELKTVIPDRWNSPNSFKSFFSSANKEALLRKLSVPLGRGLLHDDIINRSCSEWSDDDLMQYLAFSDNHKRDPDFMKQLTGYDNVNAINQRTYQVRKEAFMRGLIQV